MCTKTKRKREERSNKEENKYRNMHGTSIFIIIKKTSIHHYPLNFSLFYVMDLTVSTRFGWMHFIMNEKVKKT